MDMVPYTLVQKIKNEFQVTLEAFRSNKVRYFSVVNMIYIVFDSIKLNE